MRIATHQMQQAATAALLDRQARLARTQLQLSTGKRILSPADDPAGAVQALDLAGAIARVEQHQRNIDRARARLRLEESTLADATRLLQRARELVVRGSNAALSGQDRQAIATELYQILDGLLADANTRDAQGEYLFAGYRSLQEPFRLNGNNTYSYLGDAGAREVQVGPARRIRVGDSGRAVFVEVPGLGTDLFTALRVTADTLQLGQPPAAAALDQLDRMLDHLSTVRASVGGRLNGLDAQERSNADALLRYREVLSKTEDLDFAQAVSDFQLRLAALQAAQASFARIQGLSLFRYL
ncbi:MAG: flagellar hook-associated protein 3 [Gammaproteobacteria bacterium]|nr:MAG: flagellar hook-associated protein 3 [Gammaproteobacteria bacterium]